MNLEQHFAQRRFCVCTGPGGVGKTSVSAAVALGMAARGRRVAVVTIDPAKRLANALGLEQLENDPTPIAADRLPGIELSGELWAMTLDPKRTFDELIDSVAPSPQRAQEIKDNPIYQELSTAVAGSQEFTAVSKLYELAGDDRFDLIVLDTPPARNAMDFLDAPARLNAFLEGRTLQAFVRPSGLSMRLLGLGLAPVLAALERVTGVELISALTGLFTLLSDMTDAFGTRARHVDALLRCAQTGFLIVTSAQTRPVDEALRLHEALRQRRLPFAGAIVNRLHPQLLEQSDLQATLTQALGGPLAAQVDAAYDDHRALSDRQAQGLGRLEATLGPDSLARVPEFDEDIHDIGSLLLIQQQLFS